MEGQPVSSWKSKAGGLQPVAGADFFVVSNDSDKPLNACTWKLFDKLFTQGTYTVTYSVGDLKNKDFTKNGTNASFVLFADVNGNGKFEWGERIKLVTVHSKN